MTIYYEYDYQGRRTKKIIGFDTAKYCYDGANLIAEYNGSDNLLRKYIHGPGIDEPIMMIDVEHSGNRYYYHHDGLGSVVALSNNSGSVIAMTGVEGDVIESYHYDVFGQPNIYNSYGELIDYSEYGNRFMFTGREYENFVYYSPSLYYYRARYYNPTIGRFLSPDPIGYADSMNLYQYCLNNPVNGVDPLGLFRFGVRDLGGTFRGSRYIGYGLGLGEIVLDYFDIDVYHQHGFFEDGGHENIGYFGPEVDPANPGKKRYVGVKSQKNCKGENPANYDISPHQYDDKIMRQAIKNVNSSGRFDPEDKLIGKGKNNCQDYVTELVKEYKRLGGKVKYEPNGRTKNL